MSALRYLAAAVTTQFVGNLKPNTQIEKSEDSQWDWESCGDDPSFLLNTRLPLYAGWFMVELMLEGPMGQADSRIYFDIGEGFNEKDSVNIPGREGRVVKRLVHLKNKCSAVRFDPMEFSSRFTVRTFRLIPVSSKFALSRRLKRVKKRASRIKNLSTEKIQTVMTLSESELKNFVENEGNAHGVSRHKQLQEYYDDTFNIVGSVYHQWISKFETPLFVDQKALKKKQSTFDLLPLITVVLPVYNTKEKYLRQAIESVQDQIYENWELCIVDDASSAPHIKPLLEEYSATDSRIKTVFSKSNEHIAGASNRALNIASGEYVAFLDHDDTLAKHALHAVVERINDSPSSQIIYSDEDKIDENNVRYSPHFKSAWNQDLFYSYNYICHFTVIRRELISKVGGFRSGVDGSQDYDLLLRVLEQSKFKNISHIPHVLYHWRAIEGSTATGSDQKNYTTAAGIKALDDHFSSLGQENVNVGMSVKENLYRIQYPIPDVPPLVSLLIPTRNGLKYLKPCVDSIIEKTLYKNYEIIILDNQTDDPETLQYLRRIELLENVRVELYDEAFNYSAINNFGVQCANGEIIGLINNDIEVIDSDWLSEMVSQVSRDEIGCVGAKLLYEDRRLQHAGVILGMGGVAGHSFIGLSEYDPGYYYRAQLVQNYSAVTAACLLLKKSIFNEVGGLDEENFKVAFNDVDLCLKVREAGYRNLWTPHATLFHFESKSRGYEDTLEKQKRFASETAAMKLKWSKSLSSDPYYSPNLCMNGATFALRR